MAYIGNEPVIGQWRKLDDISGSFNGSLTNFTTQVGGVNVTAGSANQLLVSLGGVLQEPGTDYSVSSSTITFTTAPAASLSFFAVLAGDALNTSVPADGSITTAKLGANLTVDLGLGSAGTPSLTFDADSGLFSGGDNQVAVSTSGVERVEFGASEVVFNDGGANYDFRVEGDTDANLLFVDASTDRVGIGTNSPSTLLHVSKNESQIALFERPSGSTNFTVKSSGITTLKIDGTDGVLAFVNAGGATPAYTIGRDNTDNTLRISQNSSGPGTNDLLTITSAGLVGIGTTGPSNLLHIAGTGTDLTGLRIVNTQHQAAATSTAGLKFGITNSAGQRNCRIQAREEAVDSNAIALDFFTNGADSVDGETVKMTILSSGNVGIGTTSPARGPLHVHATSGESHLHLTNADTGATDNDGFSIVSLTSIDNREAFLLQRENAAMRFFTNSLQRAAIDSSGRLLVGTSSVSGDFGAVVSTGGTARVLLARESLPTSAGGLGSLGWGRNNGEVGATIGGIADANWTSGSSYPTRLVFSTTANGATSPTERMRITQYGSFLATTDGSYPSTTGTFHSFTANSPNDLVLRLNNTSSTTPYGINLVFDNAAPNDSTRYFFQCVDNTAGRAYIYTNGGIHNYQANDSNLCDEREKKNIEALGSTWSCLKSWDLKKFHYNEDDDTDDKRYGVIAQQVAEHCPEVITDWVKQRAEDAVLDDDGNVVTPAKEEIVRMGVKEQQMYWMAIKALQEAQTRIETLEAEVAALKGA